MRANRTHLSDEELARRLQYEEQRSGQRLDTGRYTQQELDDLALARHYAQMSMDEESAAAMRPPATMQSFRSNTNHEIPHDRNYHHHAPQRSKTFRSESFSNNYADPTMYHFDAQNNNPMKMKAPAMTRNGNEAPNGSRRRSIATSTFQYSQRMRTPEPSFDHKTPNNGNANGRSHQNSFRYQTQPHKPAAIIDLPPECHPNDYEQIARNRQRQYNESNGQSSHFSPTAQAVKVDKVRIRTEDEDLELARRMQELEDRGMGQQNSDRRINSMDDIEDDTDDNIKNDGSKSKGEDVERSLQRKPSAAAAANQNAPRNDLEALAKLLSESGTDVNELSDDVLHELLGAKSADSSPTAPSKPTATSSFRNPDMISQKPSSREPDAERLCVSPQSPKVGGLSASPTAPSGVILKDFDGTMMEMSYNMDPNAKNKNKRRGLFGFAMADKNRFHLDEITSDAPTTTLLEPPPPPPMKTLPIELNGHKKVAGIPGTEQDNAGSRQTRSMSPVPCQPVARPNLHHSISGIPADIPPLTLTSGIPGAIPPKPAGMQCITSNQSFNGLYRGTNVCSACGLSHGSFLKVLDRRYHPECFRCTTCNGKIDPNDQFRYKTDERGKMHPHHRECYLSFGIHCYVCNQNVPVTPDGRVPFIKHPFFSAEIMCVKHADEPIRRCSGCQRLEPYAAPFFDLMDGDRCVCQNCCQSSLVVDSSEANPLWHNVLAYLEHKLKLPIWAPMRNIPILMVGQQSLDEQIMSQGSIHGAAAQKRLATGLCLTDNEDQQPFSPYDPSLSKPRSANIVAILCPTGLPRAYIASILAHESIHAWIKCHPNYYGGTQLSAQVEEGICQLVASLYLSDGILPHDDKNMIDVESEKKLRQYYKFCIERDQSDVYGNGYRRAAAAYRDIGMEGLLSHVMDYRDFPMQHR